MASNEDILKLCGRDKKHFVQLCLSADKLKGTLKFPAYISEKLDGVYALAHCCFEGDVPAVHIFSRTGEEYKSLEHLKPELWSIYEKNATAFIIFEAYAPGIEQPVISGWCRDTKKQHTEVKAYIHDALTHSDFLEDRAPIFTYEQRLKLLSRIEWQELHWCKIIPQYLVHTQEEVDDFAQKIWNAGGEGAIVRYADGLYAPGKRDWTMVKYKQGVSYDLEVVALQPGHGKYEGMLGALICRFKDGKTVTVGSGLTDEQRRIWSPTPAFLGLGDDIMHKIVQVDAMAESKNGVLREPRFKGIRYDKLEGDF
ncbi:MAG: hypothetical protein DBY32_11300 [Phascolarctobacterium sp.]|nr:MAG: hypothetical protein DBY32_11300 [Phascolarctobacterium sp.]